MVNSINANVSWLILLTLVFTSRHLWTHWGGNTHGNCTQLSSQARCWQKFGELKNKVFKVATGGIYRGKGRLVYEFIPNFNVFVSAVKPRQTHKMSFKPSVDNMLVLVTRDTEWTGGNWSEQFILEEGLRPKCSDLFQTIAIMKLILPSNDRIKDA